VFFTPMASFNTQAKSCWLLLFFLLFCTQGSAQDANCSNATEQPVFSGIYPPAGTALATYTIFGELLNQVVAITITNGSVDVTPNILSRNSSEIQFRFGNNPSLFPATANVSLQPNNSACETLSRTVSLHRSRKSMHDVLGVASAHLKLGCTSLPPLSGVTK